MALDYKILWFEDNSDVIEDNLPEVTRFLVEKGYTLDVEIREDKNDIEEVFNQDFDLILSDINLAEGETGNEIIKEIRKRHIYTEVLFYSGSPHEIARIISEETIERASFCSGIENLLDKISHVISLTIRKLQEVNSVRGLFMSETSELDLIMTDIINLLINSFEENERSDKKTELLNKVVENRLERIEKMKEIAPTDNIKPFIERLDSSDRISSINRLVKAVHKKTGEQTFKEYKDVLSDYNLEILKVRNTLAHAKLINDDGVKKVVSSQTGEEVNFDDPFCNKMRKDIKRHRENLDNLLEKVSTYTQ